MAAALFPRFNLPERLEWWTRLNFWAGLAALLFWIPCSYGSFFVFDTPIASSLEFARRYLGVLMTWMYPSIYFLWLTVMELSGNQPGAVKKWQTASFWCGFLILAPLFVSNGALAAVVFTRLRKKPQL